MMTRWPEWELFIERVNMSLSRKGKLSPSWTCEVLWQKIPLLPEEEGRKG